MEDYEKPSLEIADIFEKFDSMLGSLPPEHWKVVQAIKNCRTGALGGHLLQCGSCDFKKNAYNSCRNRHCSKCGFTKRNQWVEKRCEELLECPYFHVVFTLPSELRALVLQNKKVMYDILFKASSETLKQVAKDRLKVNIGCIGVLHTWNQTLIDHPHVHFIVPGGGLTETNKWVKGHESFFLPVKILSQVFRGKFLQLVREANDHSQLKFFGSIEQLIHPGIFDDLLIGCASKEFVVYSKPPFVGPEAVIKYLGQYTHRIAISNYRLLKLEGENIYFKYRDPKDPSKKKTMVLHVKEFMRRFLLHVLPLKFTRIRHFGLFGSRYKKDRIKLIRDLLGIETPEVREETWKDLLKRITGVDADKCPHCQNGVLEARHQLSPFYSTA